MPPLSFRIDEDAELELIEAIAWYEEARPGKGVELLDEFHAIAQHAAAYPQAGSPFVELASDETVRRFVFSRFPYALITIPFQGDLVILAVAQQDRRPGYWLPRLSKFAG